MEAKELMLGDWVNFGSFIRQVIQPDYYQDVNGDCVLDGVEPIPITAEILEKNGFRLIGKVWQKRGYTYCITVEFTDKVAVRIFNELKPKDEKGRQDMVSYNRDWANTLYVHEFQRALRCCGLFDKASDIVV